MAMRSSALISCSRRVTSAVPSEGAMDMGTERERDMLEPAAEIRRLVPVPPGEGMYSSSSARMAMLTADSAARFRLLVAASVELMVGAEVAGTMLPCLCRAAAWNSVASTAPEGGAVAECSRCRMLPVNPCVPEMVN